MPEACIDFLRGPGFISGAIAYYGYGSGGYSHAANLLADGRYLDARSTRMGGVWYYGPHEGTVEEVPSGVHIRDPHWEPATRRTRAILPLTQTEYDDWEANLRAKIGTPYAGLDIWGFISGRKVDVHGMWDCSQLSINALQHIKKIRYPLSVEAHQISPNVELLLVEQAGATLTDVTDLYKAAS
jgi:hypothetical protein